MIKSQKNMTTSVNTNHGVNINKILSGLFFHDRRLFLQAYNLTNPALSLE